ncbi:MAG: Na+/H+ antiporter subunit E [Pseudomonadota bacterium]
MARTLIGAVGLAVLWLLMSGIYDKTLILIFGVISVATAIWLGRRMDMADGSRLEYPIGVFATLNYLVWLMGEIAKSNWEVSKLILTSSEPMHQKLFNVPFTQKSDLAQVVFANSITLTPGTITVETEENCFLVHAVNFSDGDMEALEDMDAHVSAIETSEAKKNY